MMLLPYINEPETGSLIPSMSTGGAPTNAMMKQIVAASKVGIIRTPNHPTYNLLLVEVTHWQKDSQGLVELRVAIVAVIFLKRVSMNSGGTERVQYSHNTLHCGYERCFTSDDLGYRRLRNVLIP
jgi:hypothetical protein